VLNAYQNKTTFTGEYVGTAEGSGGGLTPNFTNKADTNDEDFLDGYYMNGSTGAIAQDSDYFITNYIPAVCPNKNADIIRMSGFDTSESLRVAVYKSDKSFIVGTSSNLYTDITIDDNGIATWKTGYVNNYVSTANANAIAYVRVSGKKKTTASDIVVTVNEEITYTESESTGGGYDVVSVDCDFSNAKGTLICYNGGHVHRDAVDKTCYPSGTLEFPIIMTRCDAKEENDATLNAERVEGTTTEQSFDVFTVNKAERKIYATKIGAGIDRVISY
jgi:hypothetical protein